MKLAVSFVYSRVDKDNMTNPCDLNLIRWHWVWELVKEYWVIFTLACSLPKDRESISRIMTDKYRSPTWNCIRHPNTPWNQIPKCLFEVSRSFLSTLKGAKTPYWCNDFGWILNPTDQQSWGVVCSHVRQRVGKISAVSSYINILNLPLRWMQNMP